MNERIKQLAEHAGFIASAPTLSPTLEKFAESIILECVNVNYNSAFHDGEFCARELLEHFGIEE